MKIIDRYILTSYLKIFFSFFFILMFIFIIQIIWVFIDDLAGKEVDFEEIWKSRETHLEKVPGFKKFNLIKGKTTEEYTLYASHSIWNSEEDFINWTKSEEFRLAHKNAGKHKDLYLGPPQFEGFETVL